MKLLRSTILFLFFSFSIFSANSQDKTKIQDFLLKVETTLKSDNANATIDSYRKSISNRKIVVTGSMQVGKKTFKQKIKYYRSGMKKEIIKVYEGAFSSETLVLYVVKINDKIAFVQYVETARNAQYEIVKLSKEVLIDGKLYKKTVYGKSELTDKTESSIKTTLQN